MIVWGPIVAISAMAAAGAVLRYEPERLPAGRWNAPVGVLGAYSIGLLTAWIAASLLRSTVVLAFSPAARVSDFVLGPFLLFAVEGWLLLALVGLEAKQSLGGRYRVEDEWHPTVIEGVKQGLLVAAACTVIFFPTWWLIRPGEYGTFDGTWAESLVFERASAAFEPPSPVTDAAVLAIVEQRRAIPEAIVLAAIVAGCLPLLWKAISYVHMSLNDEYVQKTDEGPPPQDPREVPRGGGLN